MYRYLKKTRPVLKYCFLTSKYVNNESCNCVDVCKMAVYCNIPTLHNGSTFKNKVIAIPKKK